MKRLHLFGLALMAIFAVSASASTIASAEILILPTPSTGNPVTFEFNNTSGTKTTLETASGKKITCTGVTGKGQATSARLGTAHLIFTGCLNTATLAKCTALDTKTSGEILAEVEWHLRHLLDFSGVALVILVTEHVHFSCAGILYLVLGCVASMDLLTASGGSSIVEKLVSSVFVSFLLTLKGKQVPLEILMDDSLLDEICMLESWEEAQPKEEAAQLGEGTLENFKQNGNAVTLLVHLK